jgi:hypothetical protein
MTRRWPTYLLAVAVLLAAASCGDTCGAVWAPVVGKMAMVGFPLAAIAVIVWVVSRGDE